MPAAKKKMSFVISLGRNAIFYQFSLSHILPLLSPLPHFSILPYRSLTIVAFSVLLFPPSFSVSFSFSISLVIRIRFSSYLLYFKILISLSHPLLSSSIPLRPHSRLSTPYSCHKKKKINYHLSIFSMYSSLALISIL